MKSIGSNLKGAHFSNFNPMLQAAIGVIGGLFIAATLILGGQAPAPRAATRVTGDLSAVERYLTHLATDKPIYRTGEKVYVRGVVLGEHGHSPNPQGSSGPASFEIKGPKGDTVASGTSTLIDSVVGFSWDIPAGQAGGEYTVRVSHPLS